MRLTRMRLASVFLLCAPLFAQPRALTAADYARAEKFMAYNTTPLVYRAAVRPNWLADERFWYRVTTPAGSRVRPGRSGQGHARAGLRSRQARHRADRRRQFQVRRRHAAVHRDRPHRRRPVRLVQRRRDSAGSATPKAPRARPKARRCHPPAAGAEDGAAAGAAPAAAPNAPSPDGKRVAFIRDWNLWVRDVATRKETQLTTRRREGFRLRHRQRRLDHQRPPDRQMVAGFQEDRDLSAGPARRRRDVPGRHARRASEPARLEVPAARRRNGHDDPARRHRRRCRHGRALPDAARPAPLLALRRPRVPRRLGGRAVESRRGARRVRLHVARPQARAASHRRRRHRRGPRRARGDGPDVLRVGQRPRQLALSAEIERDHLVFRARQLGPPVPLRCDHRQAEEPHHLGRGQRHAGAARGRRRARHLLPRRRTGEGPRSVFRAPVPHRHGRQEPRAADARERQSRGHAVALREVLRRQLLEAGRAAGRRGARRRRQAARHARDAPTSRSCSPPDGSRPCRSPSKRATAPPTSTA